MSTEIFVSLTEQIDYDILIVQGSWVNMSSILLPIPVDLYDIKDQVRSYIAYSLSDYNVQYMKTKNVTRSLSFMKILRTEVLKDSSTSNQEIILLYYIVNVSDSKVDLSLEQDQNLAIGALSVSRYSSRRRSIDLLLDNAVEALLDHITNVRGY